jgi:hypothetical protein
MAYDRVYSVVILMEQGHAQDVQRGQGLTVKSGLYTPVVWKLLTIHQSPEKGNDGLMYRPTAAPPFALTVKNL